MQTNCPTCQTANPSEYNFCRRCGRLLHLACPRCQIAVQADDDFCGRCGLALTPRAQFEWTGTTSSPSLSVQPPAPLPVQIPSTHPTLPVVSNPIDCFLPKGLAAKLDAARSSGAMVGERRVVTILFCDIKGSTAAAEKLDPEEWTEIINGAFEYMIRPVYKSKAWSRG